MELDGRLATEIEQNLCCYRILARLLGNARYLFFACKIYRTLYITKIETWTSQNYLCIIYVLFMRALISEKYDCIFRPRKL